jgi:voltage-gated potassium channel Kch
MLGLGTLAYNRFEGWSYVDSLYFSTSLLTTVGFGDMLPSTQSSKLFTTFYMLAGISICLIALTMLASYVFDNHYTKVYSNTHNLFRGNQ